MTEARDPAVCEVDDRRYRTSDLAPRDGGTGGLDGRLRALVDVVRTIAVAPPSSARPGASTLGVIRRHMTVAGLRDGDVVGTMVAVGPVVGAARLVGAARIVAELIGYDVDADLEYPPA